MTRKTSYKESFEWSQGILKEDESLLRVLENELYYKRPNVVMSEYSQNILEQCREDPRFNIRAYIEKLKRKINIRKFELKILKKRLSEDSEVLDGKENGAKRNNRDYGRHNSPTRMVARHTKKSIHG